ncbi:MAG: hypothetical protein R3246_15890 [Acidimicrobiia bacterium]|nr:hypothetical protein [Acidimicrobiia bacterium]
MTYGQPFAGLCAATAILLCSLTGYPIAPSELPATTGTLDLNQPAEEAFVTPGATIELEGAGFAPGAAVTVSVYSEPQLLAEVVADPTGKIDVVVRLPVGLAAGDHTLTALGNSTDGSVWSLQSEITVVDATSLPFTGASLGGWILAGLGSIVVGFILIRSVAGRRLLPD